MCFLCYVRCLICHNTTEGWTGLLADFKIKNSGRVCFCFLWILGIFAGGCLIFSRYDNIVSLMQPFTFVRLSIVSLLFVSSFPILFSAVSAAFSLRFLLLLVTFFRAFLMGAVGCFFHLYYGSAAWLVKSLILFSDSVLALAFIWFTYGSLSEGGQGYSKRLTVCGLLTIMVVLFDFYFVYPVVTLLFN